MLLLRRIIGYAPRIRAEIVWVAVGQVGYLIGTAAGIKVLTNIIGAEGYGKLAIGLTFAGLLNLFAYGPLAQAVLRFFSICRETSTAASAMSSSVRMSRGESPSTPSRWRWVKGGLSAARSM